MDATQNFAVVLSAKLWIPVKSGEIPSFYWSLEGDLVQNDASISLFSWPDGETIPIAEEILSSVLQQLGLTELCTRNFSVSNPRLNLRRRGSVALTEALTWIKTGGRRLRFLPTRELLILEKDESDWYSKFSGETVGALPRKLTDLLGDWWEMNQCSLQSDRFSEEPENSRFLRLNWMIRFSGERCEWRLGSPKAFARLSYPRQHEPEKRARFRHHDAFVCYGIFVD